MSCGAMHTQRYSVNVNLCVGDDHRWPSAEDWPRDSDGWSAEVPGSDSSLQLLPSPYVSLSCISPPNRYDAWRLGIAEAFHLVCTVIEMISLIQAGTRLPTLNVCEAWHLLVSSGTVNVLFASLWCQVVSFSEKYSRRWHHLAPKISQ